MEREKRVSGTTVRARICYVMCQHLSPVLGELQSVPMSDDLKVQLSSHNKKEARVKLNPGGFFLGSLFYAQRLTPLPSNTFISNQFVGSLECFPPTPTIPSSKSQDWA